jgi:hypothetical protein
MLYLLVPTGNPEWEDMRMFTSFSAVEQVAVEESKRRKQERIKDAWCFVIAYDGTDELRPMWGYYLIDGYLQRYAITQSL